MRRVAEAILAIIALLVVLVGVYYVWYSSHGWETMTFTSGEGFAGSPGSPAGRGPSWVPHKGRPLSSLRFRNAIFTMVDVKGKTHTKDVTAVLNGMAAAYGGELYAHAAPPPALEMTGPINPFSFVIKGVNDLPAYHVDSKGKAEFDKGKINEAWAREQGRLPATLKGQWRTVGGSF